MYKNFMKRLIDVILSFVGCVVLLPVFLIVSIIIYIDDPGPVLFTQKRVGKNKKLFSIHKFRSMKTTTPEIPTYMLSNPDDYITKVGRFIRKFSIDELPQMFDILAGNMSIIGPRPALWNEDGLINERDKYGVNALKPGLTGWAQINGRDELTVKNKVEYDGEYADILNKGGMAAFLMDTKCFLLTIAKVLKHEGVVEGIILREQDDAEKVVNK